MVREEGGRREEVLLDSGVLFLLPIMWLVDILFVPQCEARDELEFGDDSRSSLSACVATVSPYCPETRSTDE
jgi:hypothetical protein